MSAPGTFSLPVSTCDEAVVAVSARAVTTINGVDSPNRVDVIALGPDKSAQRACEVALGVADRLTGPLGQRVVRECSTEPLTGDSSGAGWELVSPALLEGVALRMRVGWPETWEIAECTRIAMLYLSGHPSRDACDQLVDTMEATSARADEAEQRAVRTFLKIEIEREKMATEEECRKIPPAKGECLALAEVAKHVEIVCDKPMSKGCTRAKEAVLLLDSCNLTLSRSERNCEDGKTRVQMLEGRLAAPAKIQTEPVPFCRPTAGS